MPKLTDREIAEVASDVLRRLLPSAGFEGVIAVSDIDFDGEPIIRMTARYDRPSEPRNALIGTLHPIRSALIERGDDRFIVLANDVVTERQTEPDVE